MNKVYDAGWNERMNWLIELIELREGKEPRKLLKEALNMYPLYYTSTKRAWLSMDTYKKALELMGNK